MTTLKFGKDLVPVCFHRPIYLNRPHSDPSKQRGWSIGGIHEYPKWRYDQTGKFQPTKRRSWNDSYMKPFGERSRLVTNRFIYLIVDRNLETGEAFPHHFMTLHADDKGHYTGIGDTPVSIQHKGFFGVVALPTTINGYKVRFAAIESRIQLEMHESRSKDPLARWIDKLVVQPPHTGAQKVFDHHVGTIGFQYLSVAMLGSDDLTNELGEAEDPDDVPQETVYVWRFPVFAPVDTALDHAAELRKRIVKLEKTFGLNRTLINKGTDASGKQVQEWARMRLVEMLSHATVQSLADAVEDHGKSNTMLGVKRRSYAWTYRSQLEAIELAAGNLAAWMLRAPVLSWIDMCHEHGIAIANVKDPNPRGETARLQHPQEQVLADVACILRDAAQTATGSALTAALHARLSHIRFLGDYLLRGGAVTSAVRTRKLIGYAISIQKTFHSYRLLRAERSYREVIEDVSGWMTAAKISKLEIKDMIKFEVLTFETNPVGEFDTPRDVQISRAVADVPGIEKALERSQAAANLIGMIGWLSTMESIRAHSEAVRAGRGDAKQNLALASAVMSQALTTSEIVFGSSIDALQEAGRPIARGAITSLGAAVAVADATVSVIDAQKLADEGDPDAAMAKGFSAAATIIAAALVISAPFGFAGAWLAGPVSVVAGVLSIVADYLTEDTWDKFLNATEFGEGTPAKGFKPDWAPRALDEVYKNPVYQLQSLANIMSNFSVSRPGPEDARGTTGTGWGMDTVQIKIATGDPYALFVLDWTFKLADEHGVMWTHITRTVAANFAPDKSDLLDGIKAHDGKPLAGLERPLVKQLGKTLYWVAPPFDMRRHETPSSDGLHTRMEPIRVCVRRRFTQAFGRQRSETNLWTPEVCFSIDIATGTPDAELYKL